MNQFRLAYQEVHFGIQRASRGLGCRVYLQVAPSSDDGMDTVTHQALLRDRREANILIENIRRKGVLNLDHWIWNPSVCSAYAQLQCRPTAEYHTEFTKPPIAT